MGQIRTLILEFGKKLRDIDINKMKMSLKTYCVQTRDNLGWHRLDGIVMFDNWILFSDLYSAEADATPTTAPVERRKINSLKLQMNFIFATNIQEIQLFWNKTYAI